MIHEVCIKFYLIRPVDNLQHYSTLPMKKKTGKICLWGLSSYFFDAFSFSGRPLRWCLGCLVMGWLSEWDITVSHCNSRLSRLFICFIFHQTSSLSSRTTSQPDQPAETASSQVRGSEITEDRLCKEAEWWWQGVTAVMLQPGYRILCVGPAVRSVVWWLFTSLLWR